MKLLVLVLLLLPLFSYSAENATLYLTGNIPLHFDIRVSPVLGTLDVLDIENGEVSRKIADVSEASNHVDGYEVLIESVNGGSLLHSDGVSGVSYQIRYGAIGAFNTPPAVGSALSVKTTGSLTGLTFDLEEVFIDVTPGGTTLPAGVYTDTLIFTIQAL